MNATKRCQDYRSCTLCNFTLLVNNVTGWFSFAGLHCVHSCRIAAGTAALFLHAMYLFHNVFAISIPYYPKSTVKVSSFITQMSLLLSHYLYLHPRNTDATLIARLFPHSTT